jgi:hypothetical protein
MVCIALRTGDCDDDVKQALANKIIALAKAGDRHAVRTGVEGHSRGADVGVARAASRRRPPQPLLPNLARLGTDSARRRGTRGRSARQLRLLAPAVALTPSDAVEAQRDDRIIGQHGSIVSVIELLPVLRHAGRDRARRPV